MLDISSASPNEVTLVETALDALVTAGTPERLIGDRAYDSDERHAENFLACVRLGRIMILLRLFVR